MTSTSNNVTGTISLQDSEYESLFRNYNDLVLNKNPNKYSFNKVVKAFGLRNMSDMNLKYLPSELNDLILHNRNHVRLRNYIIKNVIPQLLY